IQPRREAERRKPAMNGCGIDMLTRCDSHALTHFSTRTCATNDAVNTLAEKKSRFGWLHTDSRGPDLRECRWPHSGPAYLPALCGNIDLTIFILEISTVASMCRKIAASRNNFSTPKSSIMPLPPCNSTACWATFMISSDA